MDAAVVAAAIEKNNYESEQELKRRPLVDLARGKFSGECGQLSGVRRNVPGVCWSVFSEL